VSSAGSDGFDLGMFDDPFETAGHGGHNGQGRGRARSSGDLRTFADGLRVLPPKKLVRQRVRTLPEPAGPVHAARAGARTSLCGLELESMLEFPRRRFPFESYDVDATCGGCAEAAQLLRRWAG
jgi:hypothetical protein